MSKIYDLTLGIEAGSREEAEQKLLRLQQIAVEHARKRVLAEPALLKAALSVLAVIGVGWIGEKLHSANVGCRSPDTEMDWKLRKYSWQLQRRKNEKGA